VAGPIALAYNLPGVDGLVLTPETAAKVLLGKIKKWDHPELVALNPELKLPDTAIRVFYRSDESGTTENVAKYLSTTAGDVWAAEPAKAWPGTVGEGREKSAECLRE
jgi:phosphate transport system substrate-binding protein